MHPRAIGRVAAAARGRGRLRLAASSYDAMPTAAPAATAISGIPSRRRSSFMKQVMEQVKKDMEADEKLKKDWQSAEDTSKRLRDKADKHSEKLSEVGESLKSASAKTSEVLSSWKQKFEASRTEVRSKIDQAKAENESIKNVFDAAQQAASSVSSSSEAAFSKTKDVFGNVLDSTNKAFSYFGEDHKKNERLKDWKASRDIARTAEEEAKAAEEEAIAKAAAAAAEGVEDAEKAAAAAAAAEAAAAAQQAQQGDALVVSKVGNSSWDRFGAGLRDSPFLASVFENPFFDRVFGESEIAASIREMKEIDYQFHLEEFAEDIEYVVAPHIIKTYLEGDAQALEKHCGEAAFAAVNASIKSRRQQKLTLDTNILAGPNEVELKGAKLMDKGPPCFIWTFNMQQVNCLRDKDGEIIEGAADDIRTVCYAMVVQRHPQLEKLDIEYPWQISELAILWNQPCF